MSGFKRYNEGFKQSLVKLYQTGKTQSELCKYYGVSQMALSKWIKQFSQVKLEDNTVMTAKQITERVLYYLGKFQLNDERMAKLNKLRVLVGNQEIILLEYLKELPFYEQFTLF